MKYAYILAAAAATVSAVDVDPITGIPTCATTCLDSATASSTTCGAKDYACQCTTDNQNKITVAATNCVIQACGQDVAINDVLPAATAFCAKVNSGGLSISTGSSTSATTSSASTSSSVVSTTSTSSSASSSKSSTPTTSSNTTSSSPSPSAVTGGANTMLASLGLAAIGALFAF